MNNDKIKTIRDGKKALVNLERVDEYKRKQRVLTPLNNVFGFDFNKPFTVLFTNNSWTVNSILKAVGEKGYTPNNSRIVLLMAYNGDTGYLKGRVYGIEMRPNGYRHEIQFYRCHSNSLIDNCWRKGDIETYRKSDMFDNYIICQKLEDIGQTYKDPSEKKVDLSQRFKAIENRYDVNLQTFDGGINIRFYQYDELDKSGYLVGYKRNELKKKADDIKRERDKNAYNTTDNSAIINELESRLNLLKAVLVEEFKQAKTSKELETFGDRIQYYNGYAYTVKLFEELKEKDGRKAYSGLEVFNNDVRSINSRIDNLFKRGDK